MIPAGVLLQKPNNLRFGKSAALHRLPLAQKARRQHNSDQIGGARSPDLNYNWVIAQCQPHRSNIAQRLHRHYAERWIVERHGRKRGTEIYGGQTESAATNGGPEPVPSGNMGGRAAAGCHIRQVFAPRVRLPGDRKNAGLPWR